jgi:putrescine transport system ATP-binding protein
MLEIRNIAKTFGTTPVLRDVSLQCKGGETLSVLGKSGCGKTTLLKIIAGLMTPDAGAIVHNGNDLTQTPVEQRGIVYLSQEPLLFPHMTAAENISFGMRMRHRTKEEVAGATNDMLLALGLHDHGGKLPEALSGGQKQRVAFGRALLVQPKVLLLDEPFGSLDAGTREEMQQFYLQLTKTYGFAALFVTHDVKEALVTGTSFARMESGELTLFADLDAFVNDPNGDVEKERRFWNNLK